MNIISEQKMKQAGLPPAWWNDTDRNEAIKCIIENPAPEVPDYSGCYGLALDAEGRYMTMLDWEQYDIKWRNTGKPSDGTLYDYHYLLVNENSTNRVIAELGFKRVWQSDADALEGNCEMWPELTVIATMLDSHMVLLPACSWCHVSVW